MVNVRIKLTSSKVEIPQLVYIHTYLFVLYREETQRPVPSEQRGLGGLSQSILLRLYSLPKTWQDHLNYK